MRFLFSFLMLIRSPLSILSPSLFGILMPVLFCQEVSALPLSQIKTPERFKIAVYAKVPNARQMTLGDNGIVYVGTLKGSVYAVLPKKNLAQEDEGQVIEILKDLNGPNGVSYHNGSLYVAEINRILRFQNINNQLYDRKKLTPNVIYTHLLNDTHHGYRYIKFGPDNRLYVGIGVPCNSCLPSESSLGTLARLNEDGSNFEIYASGIRNTMGFAWDPLSHELWFTDNGVDWLGDNEPPDELNFAPVKGMHFGFPYYNADKPDKKFNKYKNSNTHYFPPQVLLGPHVASLGMVFYNGKMFPPEYKNQIFIAEHGSWNRLMKSGYRVTRITRSGKSPISYQPFVTGWLQGQLPWGRPVDLLVMPDGALLISDDYAGVIYRVYYQ